MKTLKGQNLIHDENYILYPEGAIVNENENQEGTPVVKEVYNDILMNIYQYLLDRKVAFNNLEDNRQNGYQLIDALRKNVNELNDVERVLNKQGSTWNIDLDFSIVPNKYFIFARAAENSTAEIKTIKGSGNTVYNFSSLGFSAGDELLLIIDTAGVRGYSISALSNAFVLPSLAVFGKPLRRVDSSQNIWYENNGAVYNSIPQTFQLEAIIKAQESNEELKVLESFEINGKLVCFCFVSSTNLNKLYYFEGPDYDYAKELVFTGFNFNVTRDEDVFIYFDESKIYLSNQAGNSINAYILSCFNFDFTNNRLIYQADFQVLSSFEKTTNSVLTSNGILNFINGNLKIFTFAGSSTETNSMNYLNGQIFKIKDDVFLTNGTNATKLRIPV